MQANNNYGINGFGRIGRTTLRVWWQYYRDQIKLVAINTSGSMEIEDWFHLVKYDSNYGVFDLNIKIDRAQSKDDVSDDNPILGTVTITADDGQTYQIVVTAQRDPAKIPWGELEVNTVIESTGVFTSKEKADLHLQGGAQQVIISAPAKGEGIGTTVLGVNQLNQSDQIHSNASCTTNCVAPVAQIMHQTFGVKKAILTTIHSYTDDQNTQDNSHKDLRRARSAAENIIPTSTGAAIATTQIIPELEGLFDGLAVRVPTPTGSLSDMVFVTSRPVTVEEVNQTFIDASQQDRWQGILAVTTDPIVSSDIVGRTESSIVDLSLTKVIDGDLVKVISWYDNEWGYCCRLVEEAVLLSKN
jgi:glyceraldehyde 3-phosphate dehydrogenase